MQALWVLLWIATFTILFLVWNTAADDSAKGLNNICYSCALKEFKHSVASMFVLEIDPMWRFIQHAVNSVLSILSDQILNVLALIFGGVGMKFVTRYFGDVARYVQAKPGNIKVRQAIRENGIKLLEDLNATGKYDQIILVGHSLGTIVAYDILNHLWARHNKLNGQDLTDKAIQTLQGLENIASTQCEREETNKKYRKKQEELFKEINRQCSDQLAWPISHFITLGSPLTHADFLMFANESVFTERKKDREIPTAPPVLEGGHFWYKEGDSKHLHHGAVFAPTRWTNIYDKSSFIILGDIISGPIAPHFRTVKYGEEGFSSVQDVNVTISQRFLRRIFTHTAYWTWSKKYKDKVPDHIGKLRAALNLPNA